MGLWKHPARQALISGPPSARISLIASTIAFLLLAQESHPVDLHGT